jgi:chloramphenicol 3-O-phosphotransferase
MTTQVIVLNGGSSSGKSGIARCLQAILPDTEALDCARAIAALVT